MSLTPTIPKGRPDHPSLDYELLRAEGIGHLENLATEIWTDFNAHDPGITVLELLCYAITDLGYRTRKLPIADLLSCNAEPVFFGVTEILPSEPVTARDYRKLLIDLEGVKNAWVELHRNPKLYSHQTKEYGIYLKDGVDFQFKNVERDEVVAFLQPYYAPGENPPTALIDWVSKGGNIHTPPGNIPETIKKALICRFGYTPLDDKIAFEENPEGAYLTLDGLTKITLDLDDKYDPENESQCRPVVVRAMKRLQAHRLLAKDYVEPLTLVRKRPIAVCLHLEISPDQNEIEAAADAVWRMQQHLTPTLRFYTFKEMLGKGYGIEQIYNGPLLDHGFLEDAEVDAAQLPPESFAHSDLTHAATTTGVAVRELTIKGTLVKDSTTDLHSYSIKSTFFCAPRYTVYDPKATQIPYTYTAKPEIDLCASHIYVTQNGSRRDIPAAVLEESLRLKRLLAECHDVPGGWTPEAGIPRADLSEYSSVQYDLPGIYTVGDNDLPEDAPADRKGARKQLQAYLAFFDQILASYLLHLGEVRRLLSVYQDVQGATYFAANLKDVPGLAEIIDPAIPYAAETPATRQDRRNRVINHLLARFGEAFSDFVLGLLRPDAGPADNPFFQNFTEHLQAKADFLRELPSLGSERGKAYNYRGHKTWNTDNVAGIKKRVHRLLGLKGSWHTRSLLAKPVFRLDVVPRPKQGVSKFQILFRVLPEGIPSGEEAPYGGILLKSGLFSSQRTAQEKRDQLYSDIWNPAYFLVDDHPRQVDDRAVFFRPDGKDELISEPMNEAEAQRLLKYVIDLVSYVPANNDEGFHVFEHILLRPNDPNDDLLQLSLGCDLALTPRDPYSNWLTVVAPNWSDKFSNRQFQDHFEQTFRREMPAELVVRFCWIDMDTMREFEELYMAWMDAKALCTPDECNVTKAANALIQWMNKTPCSCSCTDPGAEQPACDPCLTNTADLR